MSTIVLRFVTCSDLVSRVIRSGEMGFPYSHVEAVTPDDHYLGAHYDGGVQKRPKDYDKGVFTKELFVPIKTSRPQALAFYAFLTSKLGCMYDMPAIGEMAESVFKAETDLPPSQMPLFICSALMIAGLLEAEIVSWAPSTLRLTTPRDLLQMCAILAPHMVMN